MEEPIMKRFALGLLIALSGVALGACDLPAETATSKEKQATALLTNQAAVTVGMPAVKNFTEKRQLKAIIELRDTANLTTYTYTLDLAGKRHKVCPSTSVGFGIPYATQYTNPQMVAINAYQTGTLALPQADPNALYSPASADGTWVLCLHPQTKELAPAFVEPRIVVYTFEMPSVD
jgi:hypothetical protein